MGFFVFIYPDRVILYCPLQSVCHILMGFFVFIYPDRVILYCPLQSVCHILMGFFVFIYPDCVILYCPLQSVCHILMGFFCVYLSRLCYFVLSPLVGMSYFNGIFLCLSIQIVLFCIVPSSRYVIF